MLIAQPQDIRFKPKFNQKYLTMDLFLFQKRIKITEHWGLRPQTPDLGYVFGLCPRSFEIPAYATVPNVKK